MPAPLAGTWSWTLLTLQVMVACIPFCSFIPHFTAFCVLLLLLEAFRTLAMILVHPNCNAQLHYRGLAVCPGVLCSQLCLFVCSSSTSLESASWQISPQQLFLQCSTLCLICPCPEHQSLCDCRHEADCFPSWPTRKRPRQRTEAQAAPRPPSTPRHDRHHLHLPGPGAPSLPNSAHPHQWDSQWQRRWQWH